MTFTKRFKDRAGWSEPKFLLPKATAQHGHEEAWVQLPCDSYRAEGTGDVGLTNFMSSMGTLSRTVNT